MAQSLVNPAMEWEDDDDLHTAASDYPELGSILVDRPDHQHALPVTSALRNEHTAGPLEWVGDKWQKGFNKRLPEEKRYNPETNPSYDWCRFRKDERCMYPKEMDVDATREAGYIVWTPVDRGHCPRHGWDAQKKCPVSEPGPNSGDPKARVDATTSWEQGGQRGGEGSDEVRQKYPKLSAFEFTAGWKDIQAKAKRIKDEGGVQIVSASSMFIVAYVEGDTNRYETRLQYEAGTKRLAMWECGCDWALYSWGRSGRWKKYEGRMCSHALALQYEASARGMFGREVQEDKTPLKLNLPPAITPGERRTKPRPFRVGMRQIETDPYLQVAPAVRIAAAMLSDRLDPNQVLATFGEGITSTAMTMKVPDLKAKVRGLVRRVKNIFSDSKTVEVEGIGEVPASEVLYPTWDPTAGLDYHEDHVRQGDDYSTMPARHTPGWVGSLHIGADEADKAGVMVCIRPPDHVCDALVELGDEDYDNLHVTLAYLGKTAGVDHDKLHMIVSEVADRFHQLMAKVGGFGVFLNGDSNVLVALIDSAGLEDLQVTLTDALQIAGLPVHSDHGYTPHLTLSYSDDVPTIPKKVPEGAAGSWPIAAITVSYGDEWVDFPFAGLAKAASTEFAGDWHNSDGSSIPEASEADLVDHLVGDHAGVPSERGKLPSDLDELDQLHGEDHDQWGECGAHDDDMVKAEKTAAAPRIRMYRSNEWGVTYCPKCWKFHQGYSGPEAMAEGKFEPIRAGDTSIGAGSIEVCSECGKTIVNSLPRDDWGARGSLDEALFEGAEAELKPTPDGALPEVTAEEPPAWSQWVPIAEDDPDAEPDITVGDRSTMVGSLTPSGNLATISPTSHIEGGDASTTTGALPEASRSWLMTGGGSAGSGGLGPSDGDIAAHARQVLAGKTFTPAEQHQLINEGEDGVIASNLDRLDIAGTHYEALEAALKDEEESEDLWLGV